MSRDFKINGTSLLTIARVTSWDGVDAAGPLRGSNPTYPGVAGDTWAPKVRGSYVFTIPCVLLGTSPADYQDRLDDLRTLLDSSTASLTLQRIRPTGGGDVTESATGDYLAGLEPAAVNIVIGRVAIDLVNLDGSWS